MAVTIDAQIEGDVELNRRLLIVADGLDDFTPPLQDIESEVLKSFDDNFASEGGLFGGWQKRKDDNPWPILQKTGEMRGNFQTDMDRVSLKIFNPTDYFAYHQSSAPRTKLPRRVMMKLDQQRKTFIVKAFQAYIVALTRGQ